MINGLVISSDSSLLDLISWNLEILWKINIKVATDLSSADTILKSGIKYDFCITISIKKSAEELSQIQGLLANHNVEILKIVLGPQSEGFSSNSIYHFTNPFNITSLLQVLQMKLNLSYQDFDSAFLPISVILVKLLMESSICDFYYYNESLKNYELLINKNEIISKANIKLSSALAPICGYQS
jgi:hypothetical protein